MKSTKMGCVCLVLRPLKHQPVKHRCMHVSDQNAKIVNPKKPKKENSIKNQNLYIYSITCKFLRLEPQRLFVCRSP